MIEGAWWIGAKKPLDVPMLNSMDRRAKTVLREGLIDTYHRFIHNAGERAA
jgi:hypothetical protein